MQTIITLYDISLAVMSSNRKREQDMVNFKGSTLTETTLYILTALNVPLHGYGIIKVVSDMTNERVTLGPGTLYGALQTLETTGAIKTVGNVEGGRKRKTYKITAYGKSLLEKELLRLKELVENIQISIKENNNE